MPTAKDPLALGVAPQAQAAPPRDLVWLKTGSGSGAVYFDADLAGYSGYEKGTVCDNRSDGRGVRAILSGTAPNGSYTYTIVKDPAHDGTCSEVVQIHEYGGDRIDNTEYGFGIA